MPKTRTSFTPETAPKGKGGSKHHLTRIKERIGLENVQSVIDFLEGEGAGKFIDEMLALTGRDFVAAYLKAREIFKLDNKPEPTFKGVDGFILEGDNDVLTSEDGRRYIPEKSGGVDAIIWEFNDK